MGREPVRIQPTSRDAWQEPRLDTLEPPELLTPTEAQHLLRVSRSWLYGAAKDGRIPSIRLGGPDGPLRFVTQDLISQPDGPLPVSGASAR
jgi:excisionase family DNA binding protein